MHGPYPKGLEGIFNLNDLLDVVGHGRDDLINEVHHAIGRVVVSFQQPGTVHCHNLPREEARVSKERSAGRANSGPTACGVK